MTRQYGKSYTDGADYVLSCEALSKQALRMYIWSMRHFHDGNRLAGREAELLSGWCQNNGYDGNLKNVQAAQFSLEHASSIFHGHKTAARRQINRLIELGVFEPVGKPVKNHPQLYVICPSVYEKESEIFVDEGTSSDNKVHTSSQMGAHLTQMTSNDTPHTVPLNKNISELTQDCAKEKTSAVPMQCEKCGSPVRATGTHKSNRPDRLFLCDECGEHYWQCP